jgi:predicted dehydrogenase
MVLETAKRAKQNKLNVVVGLQRHYQSIYREWVGRMHDGAIGDVLTARVYWNGAGVWVRERQPGQNEMEYQMRNWYYFNWLCGDHIVEQHVHNIDVCNWFKGGPPVKAQGMGGRQRRIGKDYGEIFDHHYVEFVYDDGAYMNSQCRHQPGTKGRVAEVIIGAKGRAYPGRITDNAGKVIWRHQGQRANPYQVEHDELYKHIRANKPINNAYYTAESTMTAILGRMATYSGQEISYEQALKDGPSIIPAKMAWDADPGPKPGPDGIYPCPQPGQSKVI